MFVRRLLIAALVLACCAIPASATLTTYNNLATFNAATASQTFQTISFPTSAALGSSYTDPLTSTMFTETTSLVGLGSGVSGWPAGTAIEANKCTSGNNCTATLTITLPAGVTSFDMYFGPQDFSNPLLIINNTGGNNYTYGGFSQSNITTPIFFGFTTDTPISSFTIETFASADQLALQDINIGTSGSDPADTPEVGTLLMIGTGLITLRFGRRWLPGA